MKIEIIPNVLSLHDINLLLKEVDPKTKAENMTYFSNVDKDYGVKKVKCTDHPIVSSVLNRLSIDTNKLDSCSIVYYPTGSYNAMHADNCIINGDKVEQVKPWTHTAIIFLNNNFVGGELVYPNQGCVFLPTVGTMIITPAGAEYIHEVKPIIHGERFTLVFRFI